MPFLPELILSYNEFKNLDNKQLKLVNNAMEELWK